MLDNNYFKMIGFLMSMVCITAIVIHFENTALMWWYLLPALVFGIEIKSSQNDEYTEDDESEV